MRLKFYQHGGQGSLAKHEVLSVVIALRHVTLRVGSNVTAVSGECGAQETSVLPNQGHSATSHKTSVFKEAMITFTAYKKVA